MFLDKFRYIQLFLVFFLQWDDKNDNETMNTIENFPPRNVKQENDGKIYYVLIYR